MPLDPIEKMLLLCLFVAGERRSLFRLSHELGIDYTSAYFSAQSLARKGILTIAKPGRDLIMFLNLPGEGKIK